MTPSFWGQDRTISVPAMENLGEISGLYPEEWTLAAPGGRTASIAKMYIFALAGDFPCPQCRLQAEADLRIFFQLSQKNR